MALREPGIVERHVVRFFWPYAIGFGLFGLFMLYRAATAAADNPLRALVEAVLGVWIGAGPWMSRRLVTRWDAGER